MRPYRWITCRTGKEPMQSSCFLDRGTVSAWESWGSGNLNGDIMFMWEVRSAQAGWSQGLNTMCGQPSDRTGISIIWATCHGSRRYGMSAPIYGWSIRGHRRLKRCRMLKYRQTVLAQQIADAFLTFFISCDNHCCRCSRRPFWIVDSTNRSDSLRPFPNWVLTNRFPSGNGISYPYHIENRDLRKWWRYRQIGGGGLAREADLPPLIDKKQSEPWAASQNVAEEAFGSSNLEARASSSGTGFFLF